MTGRLLPYSLPAAIGFAVACVCWPSAVQGAPAAQPSGGAAEVRLLYESADYGGALALATRLAATTLTPHDIREIHLYEALCELALGNQARAEAKLESILRYDPVYHPPLEMPNRLRLLIQGVRARIAPALAQAHYRNGKAQFDAKDCASAATEFELVLELVPEVPEDIPSSLADVRTLASGFLALCRETLAATAPPAAPAASATRHAAAGDTSVVPPVAIRRELPPWPASYNAMRRADRTLSGIVELVINRSGRVDDARLIERVHPLYDFQLLAAAKTWIFAPATRNGTPVDYVFNLKVDVR